MCRLFGMGSSPRRTRATFWLLDAPDSLSDQSHRDPDGTGLGYFDADGTPRLHKAPVAAYADRLFAEEAEQIESATFLAHIRFASTGGLDRRNTHPFEQDGRLFAHNGVLEGLAELDTELVRTCRWSAATPTPNGSSPSSPARPGPTARGRRLPAERVAPVCPGSQRGAPGAAECRGGRGG